MNIKQNPTYSILLEYLLNDLTCLRFLQYCLARASFVQFVETKRCERLKISVNERAAM